MASNLTTIDMSTLVSSMSETTEAFGLAHEAFANDIIRYLDVPKEKQANAAMEIMQMCMAYRRSFQRVLSAYYGIEDQLRSAYKTPDRKEV